MEIFENTGETLFAELLLPVPVPKLFTYRVPRTLQDKILKGQRAIVQFGDRKILTGLISNVHNQPPTDYEAKYILEILDDYPVVSELQFKLFHWIADYYVCSLGEVMNAALPSGLKLSSESMVQLHPSFNMDESSIEFSDKELMLLKHLAHESLEYSAIAKLLGVKNLYSILKSLVRKEAVILYEEVKEKYKPKTEKKIRLTTEYNKPESLESLFETLASRPKQEALLLKYLQDVPVLSNKELNKSGITKKNLLIEGLSESSLATLIKNNVFEEFEVVVSRFGDDKVQETHAIALSEEQLRVQRDIMNGFQTHNIMLLRGIT
ncbi:MAG TPA: primosomal protein N', partial [Chryseolinea sp.]|nr:primosomal protein N' [Chryseolinea sp.]